MPFIKYKHIEQLGTDEVDGILNGTCYVFPKLDGTNGQIWWRESAFVCAGSRNRELSIDGADNHGFMAWALSNVPQAYGMQDYNIYGEWLVPHTFKGYREDVWQRFYVFDVLHREHGFLHPDAVQIICERFSLSYIPVQAVLVNPTMEQLQEEAARASYLVQDGKPGEGIVIKNYDYRNRFGRMEFAKLVNAESRVASAKVPVVRSGIEAELVAAMLPVLTVEKIRANIIAEHGGWSQKYIAELLGRAFHDFVVEEGWQIAKTGKIVDFRELKRAVNGRVKELLPEVF